MPPTHTDTPAFLYSYIPEFTSSYVLEFFTSAFCLLPKTIRVFSVIGGYYISVILCALCGKNMFFRNKPNLPTACCLLPAFSARYQALLHGDFAKTPFPAQYPQTQLIPPFSAHANGDYGPESKIPTTDDCPMLTDHCKNPKPNFPYVLRCTKPSFPAPNPRFPPNCLPKTQFSLAPASKPFYPTF